MEFSIPSNLSRIREISRRILQCLKEKKLSEHFLFDVKLACEEAIINAIKYGNKSRAEKVVRIKCDITDRSIVIAVQDEGLGFDYKNLPDPTEEKNVSKTGGRGLFIIRNVMDKVEFNSRGNRITMTKFFPKNLKTGVKNGD